MLSNIQPACVIDCHDLRSVYTCATPQLRPRHLQNASTEARSISGSPLTPDFPLTPGQRSCGGTADGSSGLAGCCGSRVQPATATRSTRASDEGRTARLTCAGSARAEMTRLTASRAAEVD